MEHHTAGDSHHPVEDSHLLAEDNLEGDAGHYIGFAVGNLHQQQTFFSICQHACATVALHHADTMCCCLDLLTSFFAVALYELFELKKALCSLLVAE